jgi:AraC family transcriptional regulator, transcriptional activator of the genes for pyochelin and ferripyochelin receptors
MLVISAADYEDLWDDCNPGIQYSEPNDDRDIIYNCPDRLGRGYERSIQLRGIELLLIDTIYHEDLRIASAEVEDRCIEFGFNLSGTRVNRFSNGEATPTSRQNFLQWGISDCPSYEILGIERIVKVDIHLESIDILRSFVPRDLHLLPSALKTFVEEGRSSAYDDLGVINPAMKLALEQIIDCPYQGLTKHIYLEAKCLELIVFKLEQLAKDATGNRLDIVLKPDDIDRIYHARDILISNLDRPPSLLALARQVGLNDCTLKKGFRQIFGTTAFGYLHDRRMDRAKTLLLERELSVNRVAQLVGYASRSAFVTAFRKRFGVNPSKIGTKNSV